MNPGVQVGFASEIPAHGRTFDPPDIPDPILVDVTFLEKRYVMIVEAVGVDVFMASTRSSLQYRGQQIAEDIVDLSFLV